jgi:hypothetical protein
VIDDMDVAARMAGSAEPAERPGWWSTIGAVLADLGPMLAVGFVFAGTTCWYLTQKTGVHPRRWPLALVAAAVGWFPLDGEQHGFLLLSGGAAFAAVVIAARSLSLTERRPTPWSRPLVRGPGDDRPRARRRVGLLRHAAPAVGGQRRRARLDDVASQGPTELTFALENQGLASVRIRELRLVGAPGLHVGRVRIDDPDRTVAPTIDELRTDLRDATLAPDHILLVYVSVSADCGPDARRAGWTPDALDVRLRNAGFERTQRVALEHVQHIDCR